MKQTLAGFPLTPAPSWGTAPKARMWAEDQFRASTGELHPAGSANYEEIVLTPSGDGFTFPSTEVDTTDDSSDPNATYSAAVYNGSKLVYNLFDRWAFKASLGTTISWDDLEAANVTRVPLRDDTAYSKVQTDLRIASTLNVGNPATASDLGRVKTSVTPADAASPVAVEIADPRVVDVTRYGTLAQAVAAIGSAQTTLQVTTNLTVSSNLTVPENIVLQKKGAGKIIVATGAVLTLARTPDVPRIQFFDQTGVSVSDVSGAGTTTLPSGADSHYIITSASANFVSGDVGGFITLTGAGVGGATMTARIIARISATQARLDKAIRVASLTNATLTFRFGTVAFSGSKLGEVLPEWWGASGDGGTTVNERPFQLALNSVPTNGGKVKVGRGDFYFTSAIFPKTGTTLEGEGYSSKLYVPTSEWDLARYWLTGEYRGLISVNGVNDVRITGLRLVGSRATTLVDSHAKMIYSANAKRLKIDHNRIEAVYHESIWQGGDYALNTFNAITDNYFTNCGTAIQASLRDSIIADNTMDGVGAGILPTGDRLTISNNHITLYDEPDATFCIYVGDNTNVGLIQVVGNFCSFNGNADGVAPVVKAGIVVTTNVALSTENFRAVHIVGNYVRLVGTAATNPLINQAYLVRYHHNVSLVGNFAEIDVRGMGFGFQPTVGAVSDVVIASVTSNTVQVNNESGQSFGFRGLVTGAGTLTVFSANNVVRGISSSGFSYFYDNAVGTVSVTMAGDITYGTASIKLGSRNFFSGTESDVNGKPLFASSDLTTAPAHLDVARVGMLNLQNPLPTVTIASDAITLAGVTSGNSYSRRRTRIVLDTEGGAASDDLISIAGGIDGDEVELSIVADARNVVVKHNAVGGNLRLNADHTLDTRYDLIRFRYNGSLSVWVCLSKMTN